MGNAGGGSVLPSTFQAATLSISDLGSNANRSNKAILHSCKSSGDRGVNAELWRKTLEERDKGWLKPIAYPFSDEGRLSRRFGMSQSGKVRPLI